MTYYYPHFGKKEMIADPEGGWCERAKVEAELARLREELLQEQIDCHIHADEADSARAELRKWREVVIELIESVMPCSVGIEYLAQHYCKERGLTLDEPEGE